MGSRAKNANAWVSAVLAVILLTVITTLPADGPATGQAKPDANTPADEAKAPDPNIPEGYLEKHSSHIRKLIRLRWTRESPRFDRGVWERSVTQADRKAMHERLLKKYRRYAKPEKSAEFISKGPAVGLLWFELHEKVGGYHSNDDKPWRKKVTRKIENGKLHGMVHARPSRMVIRLTELVSAPRQLFVRDRKKRGFRLTVTDESARLFVALHAPEDGRVRMAYLTPKACHVAEASNFRELYRQNAKEFEELMFPMLRRLGVSLPPRRSEPPVVGAVLSELMGEIDQAERDQLASLFTDLGGAKAARQSAIDRLNRYYARYRKAIASELKKADLPSAVLKELKTIAAGHPVPEEYAQLVDALGLLDDAEYLSSLLADAEPGERTLLAGRLAKLTGQDFGTDAAAWGKWLASRPEPPAPPGADAKPAVVKAALGKHRKYISKIACLKWTSQGIRVDQDKWKTAFEDRTDAELLDELHRLLREAGQPEERIKGETQITTSKAPWAKAQSLLYWAAKSRGGGVGHKGLLGVKGGTHYAHLKGGDLKGGISSDRRRVKLTLQEEKPPERLVKIYDEAKGAFRMSYVEPAGRQVVVYNEAQDGRIRLLYLHGQEHLITEASSLEALYKVHKDLLRRDVFPMLEAVGVSLPKTAPPKNDPSPVKNPIKPLRITVTIYDSDPNVPPRVIDIDDDPAKERAEAKENDEEQVEDNQN
jgi:hypothetical protein